MSQAFRLESFHFWNTHETPTKFCAQKGIKTVDAKKSSFNPRLLLPWFFLFLGIAARGQQQPMFTQYMFNGLVLNPAYAGSQNTFEATGLYRKQWVGFEDSPATLTFSAHSPIDNIHNTRGKKSKVSLGLTIVNDRIAITEQTGIHGSYAYRIKLRNKANLAMGIQAGVDQLRVEYSKLELDDPSFAIGDVIRWKPNFGAGVYYNTERLYFGLSAPRLLETNFDNRSSSSTLVVPHYFLTMGYAFEVSYRLKLKPSLLFKSVKGNPLQMDVNCNLLIQEIVNLGISWRSFESLDVIVQIQVNPRFTFGYAYDIPGGSDFAKLNNGSHEFMVNYRVPNKKIKRVSPRFF